MSEQKVWKPEQFIFIQWSAIPAGDRNEAVNTQAKIAKKLHVDRKTLQNWKKLDGFPDAVYAEVRRNLDWRLPEILKALGDKAEEGIIPAIKLVLELLGRYQDSQRVDFFEREYGADEMKSASEELQKREQERFGSPRTGERSEAGEGSEGPRET